MKKYLVGIPCLYGAEHTREAIESVVHKDNVHVLLIDNGAEQSVKDVINSYSKRSNVFIIHNKENIYVNPAWNQIIDFFLKVNNDPMLNVFGVIFDYLLIMNSDLICHPKLFDVLDSSLNEKEIPIPVISTDKNILNSKLPTQEKKIVYEGIPGVLIILNRLQADMIFPIPDTLKVWFGDNWIYDNLRLIGFKTVILSDLITYHSGSQNVSKVKGIGAIIENDKLEWAKLL